MTKKEFLSRLSEALEENMDEASAYSHISYYNQYIDEQAAKGRTEEEVVSSLGNPRIIARTIIDSEKLGAKDSGFRTYDSGRDDGASGENFHISVNGKRINPVIGAIVGVALIALVIVVMALFLRGIAWITFRIVLPIVIVAALIGIIAALVDSLKKKR